MPHVKDLPAGVRPGVPPDHVIPRPPAVQREIARQQARIAARAIDACTPLPNDLVQRALAAADHADKAHASEPYSQRGERAGECLGSILGSLGLDADDPALFSRDEDDTEDGAYTRAVAEARQALGREAVQEINANVQDAAARFTARLRLRSAIRAKAAEDLQAGKALRAAGAGNSAPLTEHAERRRLADALAAYDATYGLPQVDDADPLAE